MDSLLESYASSDEEEENEEQPPRDHHLPPPSNPGNSEAKAEEGKGVDFLSNSTSKGGSVFDSMPPFKSSLFNSLPPPKSHHSPNPRPQLESKEDDEPIVENSMPKPLSSSSSLFSSLPRPKSSSSSSSLFSALPQPKSSSLSSSASKKIVQFRPPAMPNIYSGNVDDEDDNADGDEKEREKKRSKGSISTSSATSFLSSIPAPRYSSTLGALPSASGTGRRSMLETVNPASSEVSATGSDAVAKSNVGHFQDQPNQMNHDYSGQIPVGESDGHYDGYGVAPDGSVGYCLGDDSDAYYGGYGVGSGAASSDGMAGSYAGMNTMDSSSEAVDHSYANEQHVEYPNNDGSYGDYGNTPQFENNWDNMSALPDGKDALQFHGKRGRKDVPPEIVEVKQDELMKNRPREDKVRATGMAFGPAYQPTSSKGKPSKLLKRKHQIGTLYYEMKQKEMELAERRAKGYLTKSQTQAKYGW